MFLLIFWIIAAIAIGYVASQRGRSGWGFFLLATVVSPLIAGFVVVALPALAPPPAKTPGQRATARRQISYALVLLVVVVGAIWAAGTFRSDSGARVYSGWLRPDAGARVAVCKTAGETGCIPAKFQQPLRVQ